MRKCCSRFCILILLFAKLCTFIRNNRSFILFLYWNILLGGDWRRQQYQNQSTYVFMCLSFKMTDSVKFFEILTDVITISITVFCSTLTIKENCIGRSDWWPPDPLVWFLSRNEWVSCVLALSVHIETIWWN